ncbi:Sec-independent protein translocase subunit TatC [soil metagenome]
MFVLKPNQTEMPFLDHLEELRWRLLLIAAAVIVTTGIGFFLVTHYDVLGLLIRPIEPLIAGSSLKYLSPTDPFFITLKLALMVGIILAGPILIYQIWAFFAPALTASERRTIIPALYFGVLLFAAGAALAYFYVIPLALRFSMGFQTESLEQAIVIGEYLSVVITLIIAFGVVFELPIVLIVLSVLGIVTPEFLATNRRYAAAIITVAACMITPGDIASSFFMMLPLFVLYEVSIVLSKFLIRRQIATAAALEA